MSKFINMNQNEWHKLNQFSQFNSVEEMNVHVNSHSKQLNKGEYTFLQSLSRYSLFNGRIGVCWRKKDELSTELQKSTRTIVRYTKQLIEKGIIKVVKTLKSSGKQGANIFIIQPSSENVTPESASNQAKKVGMSLLIKADSKSNSKSKRKESVNLPTSEPTIDELDHSFLPTNVPKEFIAASKPFFNANEIWKLWGKVLLAACIANIDVESLIQAIIQQFKATVFMLKQGRIKDLYAYWYSGIYQVFIQHKRKQNQFELSWLTA